MSLKEDVMITLQKQGGIALAAMALVFPMIMLTQMLSSGAIGGTAHVVMGRKRVRHGSLADGAARD